MLKFFACSIWLGFGFNLAFKILFYEERKFAGFPIPLITMLVMMLYELEYVDKLFPQTTHIILEKNKTLTNKTSNEDLKEDVDQTNSQIQSPNIFDKDDYVSTYVGESEDEKNFLQFAGEWSATLTTSPTTRSRELLSLQGLIV